MSGLTQLAEKFDAFEPTRIEESEREMDYFIKRFKHKVQYMDRGLFEVEENLRELTILLNRINNENSEKINFDQNLKQFKESLERILRNYNEISEELCRSEELLQIVNTFSPNYLQRVQIVLDSIEDLIENLTLSLECHDELKKLEALAGEYAKIAPVIDLDKLCEET